MQPMLERSKFCIEFTKLKSCQVSKYRPFPVFRNASMDESLIIHLTK